MISDPIAAAFLSETAPPLGRGRLSARMVGQLAPGEQFVVWALRQRQRDAAPASAVLVQGFRLAFEDGDLEPALAAFECCFRGLATRSAPVGVTLCPLRCACLSSDEDDILGSIAATQLGEGHRSDAAGTALVEVTACDRLREQVRALGLHLLRAGLVLPAAGKAPGLVAYPLH